MLKDPKPGLLPVQRTGWTVYLRSSVAPIALLWLLVAAYLSLYAWIERRYPEVRLSFFFTRDTVLLLSGAYTFIKALSPSMGWVYIFQRLRYTLLAYSLVYGILAFPLWLAAFFQPFPANSFVHVLLLVTAIDILFGYRGEPDPR